MVDGAFISAVQNRILLLTGRSVSKEEAVVWAVEYVAIMPRVVDLPWNRSDRINIARRVSHGVNSRKLEDINKLLDGIYFPPVKEGKVREKGEKKGGLSEEDVRRLEEITSRLPSTKANTAFNN